jgi:hypothetical protein
MANRGNRRRADTDDSITEDGPNNDYLKYEQITTSRKLIILPEKPKSNDARRALNGLSAENKKARRLKLVWIRKLVVRCRKYTRERVEDMPCDKAFDVGLRLRNIIEYVDTITSNTSDELLHASFLCERSQFKDGDGKWRSVLEDDFLKWVGMAYVTNEDLEGARESWVKQLAAEQLNMQKGC